MEIGVAALNVRHDAASDAAPGLAFTVTLSEPSFDTSVDVLRRLVDACLDGAAPDLVLIGPRPWFRDLRAGWATFTRSVNRELLPAGAVAIPTHGGTLILAHTEDPASESPAAREAVAQVRAAIDSRPPSQPPQPVPVADPPPPVLVEHVPAYLPGSRHPLARTSLSFEVPLGPALPFVSSTGDQPPPPPATLPTVRRAPAHLSATAPLLDLPIAPALPFTPSEGAPPLPPPTSLPRVNKAPAHLSATMNVLDLPAAAVLPFVKSTSDEPPELTLEEYAALRANLTVKGEDDPGTWKEFRIASHAMKEALQARFAARFRDDPEARDRFVALVQGMVGELRAKAPGR